MRLLSLLTLTLAVGCTQPPAPRKPAPLLPDPVTKSDLDKLAKSIDASVHKTLHEHLDPIEAEVAALKEAKPVEYSPGYPSPEIAIERAKNELKEMIERMEAKMEEAKHEPPPSEPVAEAEAIHPPKAPSAEMPDASNFTGIRLKIGSEAKEKAMGFPCVPCRQAVQAVQRLANYSSGFTPDNDIWIVPVDEGVTPVWEVVVDGEVVDSKEGYKPEWSIQKILRRHPKFAKRSMLANRSAPVSGCSGAFAVPDCASAFAAPPDCATPTFAVPDCATPMMAAPDCGGFSVPDCAGPVEFAPPAEMGYYAPQRQMRAAPRWSNPLAKVPRGTPRWGYPGQGRGALVHHLSTTPHNYSRGYLNSLSYSQLSLLHSGEHEKHARITGSRAPYFPGRSGPFYGSLQSGGQQQYAYRRAPQRRGYGMNQMVNRVGQTAYGLGMMAAPFWPLAVGF